MSLTKKILVWVMRLLVGATFVFSGFAKTVDPWGFVYKLQEYLAAWGLDWLPREALLCLAIGLAMLEFVCGLMLALGCLRRAAVWILSAMMAVMLPLTFYIMIANPVADCGCFGDAWVLSNTATFFKNLVLAAMLVCLILWNAGVGTLIDPLLQWIGITASVLYCLVLSVIGWWIQPVVDFRPFPVGSSLIAEVDDSGIGMVYERDGEERTFGVDDLPDDSWTFVRREGQLAGERAIAIYDGDEEVAENVIKPDGMQVLLTVPEPGLHGRARSHMCNKLSDYVGARGGSMLGLVPLSGDSLDAWIRMYNPKFTVLTMEDSQVKELARGDAGLVYLEDGQVQWKRNLYSFPGDFPNEYYSLDEVYVVDDGLLIRQLTGLLAMIISLTVLVSLLPKRKKSA